MPQPPEVFREFGIIPDRVEPPPRVVRAYFSVGQVFGQYAAVGLILLFGFAIAILFAATLPRPLNVLAAPVPLCFGLGMAYFVGRNDYAWVELDGETIRAKHLYTRQIVERSVRDVDHLLTLVLQVQSLTTTVVNAWLGRVRGVDIRFRDGRYPLRISRVDPKMTQAQELIEAIVYRMSQIGNIEAEVIDFKGSPLLRRVYWGGVPPEGPRRA